MRHAPRPHITPSARQRTLLLSLDNAAANQRADAAVLGTDGGLSGIADPSA